MAIADWVKSKMTVIASAQSVALSDDPVPVFKQLARAGGFTNVYVGYATKTAKFSEPAGVPADYDPTIRPGISRWSAGRTGGDRALRGRRNRKTGGNFCGTGKTGP